MSWHKGSVQTSLSTLERKMPSTAVVYTTKNNQPRLKVIGQVGYDLHAALDEAISLPPNEPIRVCTGIRVLNLYGFEENILQVHPLAEVCKTTGVWALSEHVPKQTAIQVTVINRGSEPTTLRNGDKIAQLVTHCPEVAALKRIPLYATDDVKITDSGVIATRRKREPDEGLEERVGVIERCPSDEHSILPTLVDINYSGRVNVYLENAAVEYKAGDVVAYLRMEPITRPTHTILLNVTHQLLRDVVYKFKPVEAPSSSHVFKRPLIPLRRMQRVSREPLRIDSTNNETVYIL